MTNCTIDTSNNTIFISNGFNKAVTSIDQSVSVVFGPITNPSNKSANSSFTLESYTDSTYTYSIDYIDGGLIPSFGCITICETCSTTNTSECYSCWQNIASIPEIFWYDYTCLQTCPSGYYGDTTTEQCTACPTECETCSDATTCLTCNMSGSYPYF